MASYNAQQYSQASAWQASASSIQQGSGSAGMFNSNMSAFNTGFTVGWGTIGTITEPWLTYRAAKYEKAKLKMQAGLMRMQQKAQYTAADDVMRGGERQAAAIGYQAGMAKSSSRASMAAAGVQVGASGNSAEAFASIDVVKEMQVNQVMANAVAQSWGYRKAAVQTGNEAMAVESAASDISPLLAAFVEMNNQALQMMNAGPGSSGGSGSSGKQGGMTMGDIKDFASLFKSSGGSAGIGRSSSAGVSGLSSVGSGASWASGGMRA